MWFLTQRRGYLWQEVFLRSIFSSPYLNHLPDWDLDIEGILFTSPLLQFSFAKQLVEADILLFSEPEGVFVIWSFRSFLLASLQSVSMVSRKRRLTRENAPAAQSEHFCRTNWNLSDKDTTRCTLTKTKIRAGESLTEVSKILLDGSCGRVCSRRNIITVSWQKNPSVRTGADIGTGIENTVVYCDQEQNRSYLKDKMRESKPSFPHSWRKSFAGSIWQFCYLLRKYSREYSKFQIQMVLNG